VKQATATDRENRRIVPVSPASMTRDADPLNANPACPCGSAKPYAECCGRWHAGPLHLQAPDAQALMRSRYSAFVLDLRPYLIDTWHPSTRPAPLEPPLPGLRWLGLEVRRHIVTDDDHESVEFVARSKQGGRALRLHETSRFVREAGRWYYVSGEQR
jgi:SEC-C motif-containing protein